MKNPEFNRFGVFATKAAPPSSSWWTEPDVQSNRDAFSQRVAREESRMLASGGRTKAHDKGIREK